MKAITPAGFEQLVIDVLVGLGYGGTLSDAGRVVGGGGDEGIDGIIKEDRLGLDFIYVQAKRWQGNVGRPEIQRFAGALVLIDGRRLAELMIDAQVGVSLSEEIKILKQDEDYFESLDAS